MTMPGDREGTGGGVIIGGGEVGRGIVPSSAPDRVGVLEMGGNAEGNAGVTCWQAVSKRKRVSSGIWLVRKMRITFRLLVAHFN